MSYESESWELVKETSLQDKIKLILANDEACLTFGTQVLEDVDFEEKEKIINDIIYNKQLIKEIT